MSRLKAPRIALANISVALRALVSNRLRSALTLLGIQTPERM